MATSEDLVPNGLPYGERQNTKAAMQQAGTPTASSPAAPALGQLPGGGGVPIQSPPSSLATAPPQVAGFDSLAGRTQPDPFGVQAQTADQLAMLKESPNGIMRAVAALMPQYMHRR